MVDLRAKPFYLSDEDIAWVESTIRSMTPEEKVGQLFWQLTAGNSEEYLRELMEKYHLGGCRYNNMPGSMVQNQNRILQKYAKVPVFIACNTENGGKVEILLLKRFSLTEWEVMVKPGKKAKEGVTLTVNEELSLGHTKKPINAILILSRIILSIIVPFLLVNGAV